MRLRLQVLGFLIACTSSVYADVQVTKPAAGSPLQPGTIQVAWTDNTAAAPSLADCSSFVVNLCAGGNDQGTFVCSLAVIVAGGTYPATTASGDIPSTAGQDAPNGYFLQFVSTIKGGGQVTNYSPRFGLTGMIGTFPANIKSGVTAAGSSSAGPPSQKQVGADPNAGPSGAGGEFAIPYIMQTGLTKYAPMQPVPKTKITATKTAPLNPPSSVPMARTWLPPPSILTTFTQSQTFSVSSIENTAAPNPMPTDDMQKFLARWRD